MEALKELLRIYFLCLGFRGGNNCGVVVTGNDPRSQNQVGKPDVTINLMTGPATKTLFRLFLRVLLQLTGLAPTFFVFFFVSSFNRSSRINLFFWLIVFLKYFTVTMNLFGKYFLDKSICYKFFNNFNCSNFKRFFKIFKLYTSKYSKIFTL